MSDSVSPSFGNALNVIGRAVADTPSPWDYARQYQDVQKNALAIQNVQAQQAAGEAYQGAIDPSGNFNPLTYRQLLAQAGPRAAMAAGTSLANVQNISSNQLDQQKLKLGMYYGATGALPDNASYDQVINAIDHLGASGIFNPTDLANEKAGVPKDDAARAAYIQQHRNAAMSGVDQFNTTYGTRQPVPTPQGTYVLTIPPANQPGTPFISNQASPEWLNTTVQAQDIRPKLPDGTPNPNYLRSVPMTRREQYENWGFTIGPNNELIPPAGSQPPGASSSVGPGRIVPTQTSLVGPGTQRSAAAPPPAPTPAPPRAGTSAAPGEVQAAEADVAAYKQDQAGIQPQLTRAENLAHAYTALSALKSATGQGAEGINNLRSYAQTLGILPQGAVTEQQLFELVHKYTERSMLDAAGGASTDLGKRMQEEANAGTLLSNSANAVILRNDMGKVLQGVAAYKDQDESGRGYLAKRADIASTTDSRGFMWNLYNPAEQAQILKEVGTSGPAHDKLAKAIGMAQRLNLGITTLPATGAQ